MHVAREQKIAQEAVGTGAEIHVRNVPGLPPSAYLPAEDVLLSPLLTAVRQGAADGFDAIGIGCASDPGLREAKAISPVPVTGPFESAVRITSSLSFGRFSVLYPGVASGPGENLPQDSNWVRMLARDYGVLDLLSSALPVPVVRPEDEVTTQHCTDDDTRARVSGNEVLANMTRSIHTAGPEVARAAWQDGQVNAIFVACTLWSNELAAVQDAVPIPVLDPIKSLARYAALLAASTAGRR